MKEKNIRLDFVRAAAIVFMIFAHFFDHTGLYEATAAALPVKTVAISLRMMLGQSVALFMMLTGYLCCEKKLSGKYYLGIVRIYGVYLICSVMTLAFDVLVMHQQYGLQYIVGSIINFYACPYAWYMLMYLGLFLMIPFLNIVFNNLTSKKQHLMLMATLIYLTVLPSLMNTFMQLHSIWWKNLYPLLYYFTGAYLRRYKPEFSFRKGLAVYAVMLAGFTVFNILFYGAGGEWTITVSYHDFYQTYIMSVVLFLLLYDIRTDKAPAALRKVISVVSTLSLAAYLLSGISDNLIYPVFKSLVPDQNMQLLWLLPVAGLSLVLALLLAWIAMLLYKPFEKIVYAVLYRLFPALR